MRHCIVPVVLLVAFLVFVSSASTSPLSPPETEWDEWSGRVDVTYLSPVSAEQEGKRKLVRGKTFYRIQPDFQTNRVRITIEDSYVAYLSTEASVELIDALRLLARIPENESTSKTYRGKNELWSLSVFYYDDPHNLDGSWQSALIRIEREDDYGSYHIVGAFQPQESADAIADAIERAVSALSNPFHWANISRYKALEIALRSESFRQSFAEDGRILSISQWECTPLTKVWLLVTGTPNANGQGPLLDRAYHALSQNTGLLYRYNNAEQVLVPLGHDGPIIDCALVVVDE